PSFFFSSRRRHTRWPRDWSSDVCSSDLSGIEISILGIAPRREELREQLSRFVRENPAGHGGVMVELLLGKEIDDAAAGAGLGVGGAVDEPRDARVHGRPGAHGAGLERAVARAAFRP